MAGVPSNYQWKGRHLSIQRPVVPTCFRMGLWICRHSCWRKTFEVGWLPHPRRLTPSPYSLDWLCHFAPQPAPPLRTSATSSWRLRSMEGTHWTGDDATLDFFQRRICCPTLFFPAAALPPRHPPSDGYKHSRTQMVTL